MTDFEAMLKVRALLDELRTRYVPDEKKEQGRGQLGFDYGYQQALAEVESGLYLAFSPAKPVTADDVRGILK